jgi:soluble lytic murein transglycosylase
MRRLSAALLVLPLVTVSAGAQAPVPTVAATATSARALAFDPGAVAPLFSDGPGSEAMRALRLEQWGAAVDGFSRFGTQNPKAPELLAARTLLAYAALKAGRFSLAATTFAALAEQDPLLTEYHLLWGGRASLSLGEPKQALARAGRIAATSPLDAEARLLRAEAHKALGQQAEAAVEYRGYVDKYPSSWRLNEVRFRLAEALSSLGRDDEARAVWLDCYVDAPESWGQKAEAHLTDADRRLDAARLSQRALRLFDAMRNEASEQAFLAVLKAPGLTDALTCTARYHAAQSVFKQRNRPRAAPLFDEAAAACQAAHNEELWVKSLYQAGRCWATGGDKEPDKTRRGIERFEAVWREHPTHSYADDARVREAEVLDGLKEEARATALLADLPKDFPTGDQLGEAMWRLAFRAYRRGRLDEAKRWLESALAARPREEGWWEAGRTLYWLGRVAARAGDEAKAAQLYVRAAREYPLSFYALASLNRLHESRPGEAEALVAELAATAAAVPTWSFSPRPLFGEAGFRRAVQLARLGFGAETRRELAALGIQLGDKARVDEAQDPARVELLWAVSLLFSRAGEPAPSHQVPRAQLVEWTRHWPTGQRLLEWQLAYPRGYAALVEPHAAQNGQPPALQFAIIREESAFDPLMESFANAVGLTQLTAEPAARFAQGLPHDRQALRDPTINVTIGARELGQLYGAFARNAPLAIAGYNAGEGAVRRWLRDPERAQLDLDGVIESIPYDETRGYTKRVMASYFAYQWLERVSTAKGTPKELFTALVPTLGNARPTK